jgi:hypothetical protein
MAASTDRKPARWPRDLKLVALLAALWAAALVAQIVIRDITFSPMPLQTIALGMKFEGLAARIAMVAQAAAISAIAFGLAAERKSGLWFALIYMLEVVVSRLIFMISYMDDISQAHNVRVSGLLGIGAVLILLYLWIRAHEVLFDENQTATSNRIPS